MDLDDYSKKVIEMWGDHLKWRAANPGVPVIITFKMPRNIFVAATPDDAIASGFLIVDDNGMRMLKELRWIDAGADTPSINMVRMAIEGSVGMIFPDVSAKDQTTPE